MSGPWREEDLARIATGLFRRRALNCRALAKRLVQAFEGPGRPSSAAVAAFLYEDERLRRAVKRGPIRRREATFTTPVMWPMPGAPEQWALPAIVTPKALADFLGLEMGRLEWLADIQGRNSRASEGPLRHYRYLWRRKRSGEVRVIEVPKATLMCVQRQILNDILNAIPPHEAAHGFRQGRSIRTFAMPHVGQTVVLRMDLRDFFPSVSAARTTALFRVAGYPEPVARLLAGLCTNRVPADAWDDRSCPARGSSMELWRLRKVYASPHLPQGAPTSPALANFAAFRLDARLQALAQSALANYTRYADDLAFSGGPDFARRARRFIDHVGAIAIEEGFAINPRKTRLAHQGRRQVLAGVVVNQRPNTTREDYDRLKATLRNCRDHGPESQNRGGHPDFRAHLAGRIAHVASIHPQRGAKLRAMFEEVHWEGHDPINP